MSRRQDVGTAALGTTGVVGGALLRDAGLHRAYNDNPLAGVRPRIGAERALLRAPHGRKTYVAGALLAGASITPAISGTRRALRSDRRVKKSESILHEGAQGYAESLKEKRRNVAHAPASLNALNYAGSAGATAGGAGLAHLALRGRALPRSARSAAAAVGGVALGAGTLGIQSRIVNRASRGQYEVTSTGVRRAKTAPKRASSKATRVPGSLDPRAQRELYGVGKMAPDQADYPGRNMSRKQKQLAVAAAGGPPVIGDFTAAAAAARLAPPGLRAKTAAYQYGGSNGGQLAGAAVGGYGAAHLARKVPGVGRRAVQAQDWADKQKAKIPAKVRTAATGGDIKGRALKEVEGSRVGRNLLSTGRKLAKPMFGHGKAVGAAAALGIAGGQALGQVGGGALAYNHALSLEAKRNAKIRKNTASARRGVSKRQPDTGMSMAEHKRQAQRKRKQAHISMFTGTTGLGALGATALGSKALPAPRKVKAFARAAQTPLLTAGAGVGGYGSFNFARTQLRESEAERKLSVGKAFLSPRTGLVVRRAPGMRRGYLRQTRSSMGVRTTTVRGGLG